MFQAIRVPNCPSEFRAVAENILAMATKPGFALSDYNTMTELDKNLMWDYWVEFDGFALAAVQNVITHATVKTYKSGGLRAWFVKKATPPELIRRARQWLTERNYLIVKPEVQKRAYEAGSKFSRSIKTG